MQFRGFDAVDLLPAKGATDYLTYSGSLTFPGCHETVTWILLNKALYIEQENVRRATFTFRPIRTVFTYIVVFSSR